MQHWLLLQLRLTFSRLQPDDFTVFPLPCTVESLDTRIVHGVEVETINSANRLLAAVDLLQTKACTWVWFIQGETVRICLYFENRAL